MRVPDVLCGAVIVVGAVIDRYLKIKFHETINTGLAFGVPVPNEISRWVLAGLLAGLMFLMVRAWRQGRHTTIWSYMMIVIGGASNFFDRVAGTGAIDYIRVMGLPAFNIADVLIIVGIGLLIRGRGLITSPRASLR